jgi:hypothetical protein
VGQKMVKFSDLSGELITDENAVARIVVHEHPELSGTPVEIEVLADEALAVEKADVPVALVELYLPGDDEPRRVAMDVDAFNRLATDRPMTELLNSARPARRAVKTREKRAGSRDAEPAPAAPAAATSSSARSSGPSLVAAPSPAKSAPSASAASLAAAGLAEPVAASA